MAKKKKYRKLLPIGHKDYYSESPNPFVIQDPSSYEPLWLTFSQSDKRILLGKGNTNDLMPRRSGVYWVTERVLAFTCGEHWRGASLHNFEIHLLSKTGEIIQTFAKKTNEAPLLEGNTIWLVGYPNGSYPHNSYESALMSVVSIDLETGHLEEKMIDAPQNQQPFFNTEYLSHVYNDWAKIDGKLYAFCKGRKWMSKADVETPELEFSVPLPH